MKYFPITMKTQSLDDIERDYILSVYDACLCRQKPTCDILGISPKTLRNKFKKYREQGYTIPTKQGLYADRDAKVKQPQAILDAQDYAYNWFASNAERLHWLDKRTRYHLQ